MVDKCRQIEFGVVVANSVAYNTRQSCGHAGLPRFFESTGKPSAIDSRRGFGPIVTLLAGPLTEIRAVLGEESLSVPRLGFLMALAPMETLAAVAPPENATGNYVKIVQRIPVRVTLDEGSDPDHLLRVGMSVVPTIFVER